MGIFIIAEIGINHNGDIQLAKKLIDLAKDVGCDAVKFQKRTIDIVYEKDFLSSYRKSPWGTTQREQKEGLEFGETEYKEIDNYCQQIGIDWFASAWDLKSQKFLQQFNLKYNKIASAMLTHKDLLRLVASEGKHTFISTGMSTMNEIREATNIFMKANCPFELMHCVSTYPMNPQNANLNCIKTLQREFGVNVGYSGHEPGLSISIGAAALGISSLERHITLDTTMYGSDQAASVGPAALRMLVGSVRKVSAAMGDGEKRVLEEEKNIAKKLRAHIGEEKNE